MLTAEATVATLRAGDDVDAVFACSRKDRLTARSGLPYLAIELRDRSGAIQGRAFRDADLLSGRFERGQLVRVRGRVERFRDELQVDAEALDAPPHAHELTALEAPGEQVRVAERAPLDRP